MAPHADTTEVPAIDRLPAVPTPPMSKNPPRFLIIGAGSRGNAYARAIGDSTNGLVVAVAEPVAYKRQQLGQKYIWGAKAEPREGQAFDDWKSFMAYEMRRRERAAAGEEENVPEGVDGVFICVLDEMHKEVIVGLAPLKLHVMCEKPLATTLEDCVAIYKTLMPNGDSSEQKQIFSIGHVLRYSPHNMLLRKLLLEDKVVGDIMSIEHTEPVGWWHFTHSYVRGNWRKQSTTAPSLLTKSCHDIDLLLWLLCLPARATTTSSGSSSTTTHPTPPPPPPHLPAAISSTGRLNLFRRARKPLLAGAATNCLSCAAEPACNFSAKKVYLGAAPHLRGLGSGNTRWPVDIVVPDIEESMRLGGHPAAEAAMLAALAEDYEAGVTPPEEVARRNWFGRCVFEADNDVCDDQVVTITWDDDPLPPSDHLSSSTPASSSSDSTTTTTASTASASAAPTSASAPPADALGGRGAKTAVFHMVAFTRRICERYTAVYGTRGELHADSATLTVSDFAAGTTTTHRPHLPERGGHGGGDDGLARQFVLAVDAVKDGRMRAADAQAEHVGCGVDEVVRSHAAVFAAEEARRAGREVRWGEWWAREVEARLRTA